MLALYKPQPYLLDVSTSGPLIQEYSGKKLDIGRASNIGEFEDWTGRASRSGGCKECSTVSFPLHPLCCYALNKMRYTDEVRVRKNWSIKMVDFYF